MKSAIQLSHAQQSTEGYCLPACVQMVLAYWGLQRSEAAIRRVLGTRAFGTPSFAGADCRAGCRLVERRVSSLGRVRISRRRN